MDNYIYILDYANSGVYWHKLTDEEKQLSTEELFNKLEIEIDNCEWIYAHNKLELEEI